MREDKFSLWRYSGRGLFLGGNRLLQEKIESQNAIIAIFFYRDSTGKLKNTLLFTGFPDERTPKIRSSPGSFFGEEKNRNNAHKNEE
jgi:hypothetical protein